MIDKEFPPVPPTFSIFLKRLFKDNPVFWGCICIFILLGGVGLSSYPQGSLLLYFSAHRSRAGDFFFRYFTTIGSAQGYLLAICFFLLAPLKAKLSKQAVCWILLTGLAVTVVSFLTKKIFLHPRPLVYYKNLGTLEKLQLIEGEYVVGGLTSFPSGHTMAGFALFSLIAFLLPQKKWVAVGLFSAALLVGISRIYLVQHFLKDVYVGAIMGVLIAVLMHYVIEISAKPIN